MSNIKYFLLTALFFTGPAHAKTPAQIAIERHSGSHYHAEVIIKSTIAEILDKGSVIKLEDGTEWSVSPDYVDYTSGWLGPADIVVTRNPKKDIDYPYIMTNKWTKASVKVAKVQP